MPLVTRLRRPLRHARVPALLLGLALSASALAGPKDDARRYFIAGLEAAQAGEYEAALASFRSAQAAFPHSATLYNIARTYDNMGDDEQALRAYEDFQLAAPEKAATADPYIAAIRERMVTEPAPAPVATPAASTGAPSSEEIERLQAIETEIASLLEAWKKRASEVPAPPIADSTDDVVDGATADPSEVDPAETDNPPVVTPPVEADGLLGDAFQRVVVTASRYGQDPLDSPSSTSVITEQEIRLLGATTVPELLRRVVGVETMSLASGHTEVSIRGFNRELSNKVLILIDGRSTYLDFIGTTLWSFLPVSLEEIERIEVIRGPGSAVYGANSVTGVVNIITRTPGEGKNVLQVAAGSPGLAQGSAVVTGRRDATSWRLSAGMDQVGRWGRAWNPDNHSAITPSVDDPNTGRQTVRTYGRVDQVVGDSGYLSLSGGYTNGYAEYYNLGALGDFVIDAETFTLRTDAAYNNVHLRAFWNGLNGSTAPWDEAVGTPHSLATPIDSDTVDLELEASHEFETGPVSHRLSGGTGYRYKRIADFRFLGQQSPDDSIDEHHVNAFINEEAAIGAVRIVGSLRADRHPLIPLKDTLSPRAALIARVDDQRAIRVSTGTAFRIPTLVESYMNFGLPTGIDGVIIQDDGDPNLRPERILTAEIGYHDESTLYHTADVAIYANRLQDVIGLTDVVPGAGDFDPEREAFLAGSTKWANGGEVYNGFGFEAEGKLFPIDGLDIFANAHLQRIVEVNPDGSSRTDESSSAAKFNVGALVRTPYRIDLSSDVSFTSGQTWALREFDSDGALVQNAATLPSRVLLNARAAARPFASNDLELALNAWNILALVDGQGAQEHPKGQPVGSRLYGSARVSF